MDDAFLIAGRLHAYAIFRKAAIGLFCCPIICYAADSGPKTALAGSQDVFVIDPTFAIQTIQTFGRQILEYCVSNFPETRTDLMAEWDSWPYSKVKIDIFVNGKLFDNESMLRTYAEQKFPMASMPKAESSNLCSNYSSVLRKISGAVPADRAAQFISLPKQSTPESQVQSGK